MNSSEVNMSEAVTGTLRDVPVDWEALEDAFENNAPEVHSYLHLTTGDVLRVVDGVADPHMHARINVDANYLRIAPVSSREQYRWMERYIPMIEEPELREKLAASIDGKGAFRRFKDVLMNFGEERERWFTFRSERLRTFMEAWLVAHAIGSVPRPAWEDDEAENEDGSVARAARMTDESASGVASSPRSLQPSSEAEDRDVRPVRSTESLRRMLRDLGDSLGPRDVEMLVAFADFLRSRRLPRSITAPLPSEPAAANESHPSGTHTVAAEAHPEDGSVDVYPPRLHETNLLQATVLRRLFQVAIR